MIEKFVSPNRNLTEQDVYDMLEVISKLKHFEPADIFHSLSEVQACITVAACTDSLAGELEAFGTADAEFAILDIQQIFIQYLQTVMVDQSEEDQTAFSYAHALLMIRKIQTYMNAMTEQFSNIGFSK